MTIPRQRGRTQPRLMRIYNPHFFVVKYSSSIPDYSNTFMHKPGCLTIYGDNSNNYFPHNDL